MRIEPFAKNYVKHWWNPILFFVLTTLLFMLSEIFSHPVYQKVSSILFVIALVALLASTIYQFICKNFLAGVVSLTAIILSFIALVVSFIIILFTKQLEPDHWADNLVIPTNIQLNRPANLDFDGNKPDSLENRVVTITTDFYIYNSFQPGLYVYDFYTGKIESGTIYLKAFEITQEYALSTSRLQQRSSVRVYNPTDTIQCFTLTDNFTIYEGDWGKPYATRFEVWFKPDSDNKERKIMAKNYIIEGWMR